MLWRREKRLAVRTRASEVRGAKLATGLTRRYEVVDVCLVVLFFFFQAEDGIRDLTVTGVQTCALPILAPTGQFDLPARRDYAGGDPREHHTVQHETGLAREVRNGLRRKRAALLGDRSEERRVGKEGRSRWSPYH